jgi:hypothetical protein
MGLSRPGCRAATAAEPQGTHGVVHNRGRSGAYGEGGEGEAEREPPPRVAEDEE